MDTTLAVEQAKRKTTLPPSLIQDWTKEFDDLARKYVV